ncbi:MAG: transglycosylase domain-containing protein, partial [Candidatus Cloacimonas sp.]|nr:transglycosylase domain-containing protein [Candidatus Cloacimonadota bacterium]
MRQDVIKYLAYMLGAVIFLSGILLGLFYFYSDQLPPLSELQNYDMKTGSEVYDVNDKLIHVFAVEHRKRSAVREFPDYFIEGLIATEDRSFYTHWGVNIKSIIRSIVVDIVRGGYAQGASTITQQLARNMFLTFEKQLPRKLKEVMLAVQIEQNYSKEEILEMYLDKIYLGGGMYGVEAASRRYFNKTVEELNIQESALIIGLIQLPNAYSPIKNPERALKRRNIVLNVMYRRGVITKEEFDEAIASEIEVVPGQLNEGAADYFIEHIRKIVENKYGTEKLFAGGLKIYTTLDYDLQVYADSVFNNELALMEQRQKYEHQYTDFPPDQSDIETPYLQGGVFGIEPETGYVRVMIGGRNFTHSKFNRITQARRQPGSSFKPIVYTAALERRYTPATIIKDEPLVFVQSDSTFWAPRNFDPVNLG